MPGQQQGSLREFGRDFLTGQQHQGPAPGMGTQGNFGFQGFEGLDLDGYQQNPQAAAAAQQAQQVQVNAATQPGVINPSNMGGRMPVGPWGIAPTPKINLADTGVTGPSPSSKGAGLGFFGKAANGLLGGGAGGGWGSGLGMAAQLAPVAYNAIQGMRKPEQRDSSEFRNPEYERALSAMSNRKFNARPMLDANASAAATGRFNLRNSGANAGQQFAGQQAFAAQRMRGDQSVMAQKQNMDNQYQGEFAQMAAGLGTAEAANRYRTDQDNLAAQAGQRNYQGTAASQLGQFAQMQQLMANQKMTEEQRINILKTNPWAAKWLGLPE